MENFNFYQDKEIGLGSNITIALALIDCCLDNNIKCHLDFRNSGYASTNVNVWDLAFNQPFQEVNATQGITNPFSQIPNFFPKYWTLGYVESRDNFDNHEFVKKYKEICKNYLIPKEDMLASANEVMKPYENKNILGMHIRGRDQLVTGHGANQKHLMTDEIIFDAIDKEIDNFDYLFFASDEHSFYKKIVERYGDKAIIYDDKSKYPENDLCIIHLTNTEEERLESLKDYLIEVLFLARCNKLLLMSSNTSHVVLFLSNHYNYRFFDKHIGYWN